MSRIVPRLRWWMAGLLFASTVINYLDRQTLSVLAPQLKTEFRWSNSDFALVVIAFRVAYAIGQSVMGKVLDRLGTRLGLLYSVSWYSLAAMLTSLSNGLGSLAGFRFALGWGEAANWPGAAKVVAEWFPRSERGWAVALYDSGSAIGGAVAPLLVLGLYKWCGSWRPAFLVTGLLGFLWVLAWKRFYHPPESHPNLGAEERALILAGREPDETAASEEHGGRPGWLQLLKRRDTWGVILGRMLTDPVWFFITDWFAVYLVSKGFSLETTVAGFWIPFLAADFGNFFGGGLSSWLIGRRGWPAVRARKLVIVVCGVGMAALIPAIYVTQLAAMVGLFAVSTFCYAAWSTMTLALPTDLFPSRDVATVSGMSGTGAGLGTIVSTYLIGWAADQYSFEPVLIVASLIPLLATALVMGLIKPPRWQS